VVTDTEVVDDPLYDEIAVLRGRRRRVSRLHGGLTNDNVKVETDEGVYVVRQWHGDDDLLGIDREAEHHNTAAAHEAGVGAPVVDFRPDLRLLVIGFLEGETWSNDSFRQAGAPSRAGAAMRMLHAGPRFRGDFDMFRRQARYRRLSEAEGFWLPSGYDDHEEAFQRAGRALASRPVATVPCNNDLLAANFIDDGERLWLIDYEYSGNNDPAFELGNTVTECDLDDDMAEELVTGYAGGPDPGLLARTRLQAVVSAYGWSLWGSIQAATSPLDFDFRAWCAERYEKAARAFTSRGYDSLLEEVGRG